MSTNLTRNTGAFITIPGVARISEAIVATTNQIREYLRQTQSDRNQSTSSSQDEKAE